MEQPLLVTAAIIKNKNKLLLIKRAREPFKDYWCFIGGCGAFEKTSDPLDAVKSEVLADINCRYNPYFFTYHQENFNTPSVTLFFYGDIKGSPIVNPKYVSEYKWFDINELKKLNLGFEHNLILKKYLKKFPLN